MEIKIDNLSKKYNDNYVLKNISFSVSNEIIGLLGHSGAGKTTLLRILSSLVNYDEGNILIDNKNINETKNSVGILLQNQELINHLNVFNNISFMIEHIKTNNINKKLAEDIEKEIDLIKEKELINSFKINKKEKNELILSLIEKYSITPYSVNLYIKSKGNTSLIKKKLTKLNKKIINKEERFLTKYEIEKEVTNISKLTLSSSLLFKKPSELSFGENQRVKLALALIKKPSLLLLDEPTGNLDPQLKKEIISNIKNVYSKLKIPIIYVTHSFDEASKVCNKLLFLNHGQIDQFDLVKNIKSNPKTSFVKSYLD